MTLSISNTPSYRIPIPAEAPSLHNQPPALLIGESEDVAHTNKLEGLYRRVCGLFPNLNLSGRDLLVETTSCLALAILVTLAIRCQNINGEMIEDVNNQAELGIQSMIEFIKNNSEVGIQLLKEDAKEWNQTEEVIQPLIEAINEQTAADIQFLARTVKSQTEKVVQFFIEKLGSGEFLWPTGVTFTMLAVGRTVTCFSQRAFASFCNHLSNYSLRPDQSERSVSLSSLSSA